MEEQIVGEIIGYWKEKFKGVVKKKHRKTVTPNFIELRLSNIDEGYQDNFIGQLITVVNNSNH